MPRYFFHLANATERIVDLQGVELIDTGRVMLEALHVVADLLERKEEWWGGWLLQVEDDAGTVVARIELDDFVQN
jgi:hypothetical protein